MTPARASSDQTKSPDRQDDALGTKPRAFSEQLNLIEKGSDAARKMTPTQILSSLFPNGHNVTLNNHVLSGSGKLKNGVTITVLGITDGTPIGVDEAILLSKGVVDALSKEDKAPIVMILDSGSQKMAKRDELLGVNEFLANLGKTIIYAALQGHPTIGLLYGHSAAGAFIGAALSTHRLVATPAAHPEVMDFPSISKVTKLPIEVLQEKAKTNPVFAPGLKNLFKTGAVEKIWDDEKPLDDQLIALLSEPASDADRRDEVGAERGERPKAALIAKQVHDLACAHE